MKTENVLQEDAYAFLAQYQQEPVKPIERLLARKLTAEEIDALFYFQEWAQEQ